MLFPSFKGAAQICWHTTFLKKHRAREQFHGISCFHKALKDGWGQMMNCWWSAKPAGGEGFSALEPGFLTSKTPGKSDRVTSVHNYTESSMVYSQILSSRQHSFLKRPPDDQLEKESSRVFCFNLLSHYLQNKNNSFPPHTHNQILETT